MAVPGAGLRLQPQTQQQFPSTRAAAEGHLHHAHAVSPAPRLSWDALTSGTGAEGRGGTGGVPMAEGREAPRDTSERRSSDRGGLFPASPPRGQAARLFK